MNGKSLCMAICGMCVYIYIYMCPTCITWECIVDFTDSTGNGCLGKHNIDTLDSSMMKKMAADS